MNFFRNVGSDMTVKLLSSLRDALQGSSSSSLPTEPAVHVPPRSNFNSPTEGHQIANVAMSSSSSEACCSSNVHFELLSNADESADNSKAPESDSSLPKNTKRKSVKFLDDDSLVVVKYHEPWRPKHFGNTSLIDWLNQSDDVDSPSSLEILSAYRHACSKAGIQPSKKAEAQIQELNSKSRVRLPSFTLRGEKVTQAQIDCLEEVFKFFRFHSVDFENCSLDDAALSSLSDILEFYNSAHHLNLSYNQNVGPWGWQELFRMLRRSSSLKGLYLRSTSVNERSLTALARVLRMQMSLTCLNLEKCSLGGKSLMLLAGALRVNNAVRELYLGENGLSPVDGISLFNLLFANRSLEVLDLRSNRLEDIGVGHICDALKHAEVVKRSRLASLCLRNNKITANGLAFIVSMLAVNRTVRCLDLSQNTIGNEGMTLFKESLIKSKSLEKLFLQATQITCPGAIALAECLADSKSLISLDLRRNPGIKTAGLLALHAALRINTSLVSLGLDPNCYECSRSRSKRYGSHFQRRYEELQIFCERNRASANAQQRQRVEQTELADKRADRTMCSSPANVQTNSDDIQSTVHQVLTDIVRFVDYELSNESRMALKCRQRARHQCRNKHPYSDTHGFEDEDVERAVYKTVTEMVTCVHYEVDSHGHHYSQTQDVKDESLQRRFFHSA
ncbi:Protein phosphatase 1 regulatory subunit 37 -like protein [Trichinella papuae]|uniref:Protein phosphatase 1 regulatory subunit 37-like protein n=1 Tax=Trichinella papuae TaxID=268474 RepID=A0A0V1MZE8_9BILA|nr:Protein phosphatase 1 regulatory subunit 37 -like protein [Trichinella papuae]